MAGIAYSIATVNHIMVSSHNLTGVQPIEPVEKKYSTLSCYYILDWTSGLDWRTGLVDWTGGLDWWTGLVD